MSQTASVKQRVRKWLKRILWGCAIAVVALAVVRAVAGVWTRREFEGRLEELRHAGEPLTLADMAPAEVPANENAATIYVKAFEQFELLSEEEMQRVGVLGRTSEPLTADNLTEGRTLVAAASEAVRLLTAGAQRPKCRYDVNYREAQYRLRLPHLQKVRAGVGLLRLAAEVDLDDGKPDDALVHTGAAVRLAHSVHDEPMLISLLIELASSGSAVKELEIVLDRSEPSAGALSVQAQALGRAMDRERFVRAIRAERCAGIELLRLVLADPNTLIAFARGTPQSALVRGYIRAIGFIFEPVLVADGTYYLDVMSRMERLAAGSHRDVGGAWSDLNELTEEVAFNRSVLHPISRAITPALHRGLRVFDYGLARSGEARIAVALRRFRIAHGQYPDALDALQGEFLDDVPLDPFSRRPFVYRREGSGFLLYSVGSNARDEAGMNLDAAGAADDVTWRCSR